MTQHTYVHVYAVDIKYAYALHKYINARVYHAWNVDIQLQVKSIDILIINYSHSKRMVNI